MKARPETKFLFAALLLALALRTAPVACAATNTTPPPSAPSAPAGTNAAAAQPIPRSVFVVPASGSEGKDPFFPKARAQASTSAPGSKKPAEKASPDQLALQGLSGSPERPLAIINGRQFAPGEESDVPVHGGSLRMRCIEIKLKDNVVLVEVAGERRELRFREIR
jgi:hypothetical protein